MAHKTRWHTKQLKTLQNWKNCETCALYISFLPNNPEFDKPLYSSTYVKKLVVEQKYFLTGKLTYA